MSRHPLIAGNWKMFKTPVETRAFFASFSPLVAGVTHCDIAICPPFPCLEAAVGHGVPIGGQNLTEGREAAMTGEVSGYMLREVGCEYVIVGHSERRQFLHETDADVLRKTEAALEYGLTPIVCVGEQLTQRESGWTESVLAGQFEGSLGAIAPERFAKVVIAYEPVWAIGTGRTATPQIAADTHRHMRSLVAAKFGAAQAAATRILYGGSVKPDNIAKLMAEEEIDGALVGGASLDAAGFASIVKWNG